MTISLSSESKQTIEFILHRICSTCVEIHLRTFNHSLNLEYCVMMIKWLRIPVCYPHTKQLLGTYLRDFTFANKGQNFSLCCTSVVTIIKLYDHCGKILPEYLVMYFDNLASWIGHKPALNHTPKYTLDIYLSKISDIWKRSDKIMHSRSVTMNLNWATSSRLGYLRIRRYVTPVKPAYFLLVAYRLAPQRMKADFKYPSEVVPFTFTQKPLLRSKVE